MPTRRPTLLKLIDGTLRADRQPVNEPKPAGQLGDAPEYFTDEQRALWNRIRDDSPEGLLTACDRGIFEGYCVLLAARAACVRAFNAGGSVLVRSNDHQRVVVNPYLKEIRRLTEQLRLLEGELGYTPAARTRIDLGEAPPAERLAKYLA